MIISPRSSTIEPLYQVKLLAALRSGDPALIHPFLTEIGKDKRKSTDGGEGIDTGAAALHLAIRCASVETITLLLSHRAISPNGVHPPDSGTTPLHLASSLGRADIVNLLLEQDGIDDTRLDAQRRNCRDVAKGKQVLRVIDDSRALLNASYRSLLHSYILSPLDPPSSSSLPSSAHASASQSLITLLSSPRAPLLAPSLNYLDDASGFTLLHAAAARRDLRMIELAVRAGADVFARDRRGRGVEDVVNSGVNGKGKEGREIKEWRAEGERVKVYLRQFANHDTTLLQPSLSSSPSIPFSSPNPSLSTSASIGDPPTLKGYLNKYTNVARGYSTRWFVLRGGVLSYYRHQDDETIASRGSISMKTAVLKVSPGHDKSRVRFEVYSTTASGTGVGQRWYMKASHPVEAARWVQAIRRSIEWWRNRDSESELSIGGVETGNERRSEESDVSGVKSGMAPTVTSRASTSGLLRKGKITVGGGGGGSDNSSFADVSLVLTGSGHVTGDESGGDVSPKTREGDSVTRGGKEEVDEAGVEKEEGEDDNSSEDSSTRRSPPDKDAFALHGNTTLTQMELTAQLLTSLIPLIPSTAPSGKAAEIANALQDSFSHVHGLISEYITMSRDREAWYAKELAMERRRQRVWEESLKVVVKEGEALERELRVRSRRRGSRFFDASFTEDGVGGTVKGRRSLLLGRTPAVAEEKEGQGGEAEVTTPTPPAAKFPPISVSSFRRTSIHRERTAAEGDVGASVELDSAVDTDEEDEFFDAIESGTLPNLTVPEPLVSPSHVSSSLPAPLPRREPTLPLDGFVPTPKLDLQTQLLDKATLPFLDPAQYTGYVSLRTRLGLDSDTRPSVSLWSVLKHSIGKDLTRITFPVFFNEPTSMLQRMAEDMEFSECLDVAAREPDPHRRIAFVAAFAMSNYSSTIGRIAKPFNPMLSETFEYVRLDKEYRYVSEQVSHHPPISACWAESPYWHYYGEVDAQNKFMGKSFEIRPTGIAHAELLLPEKLAPGYPKAKGRAGAGKVVEHFTWKKVTTNVSGFLLGSPTIDHYGDMTVTNHRTGDECILTFKPRGWRGKDAYEISGVVRDRHGNVTYEIAGRWNSQLIARAAGTGSGFLHPDTETSDEEGALNSPMTPEYILLWRNSSKPTTPFNLTPFAITLNDCPETTLKPYLCPTDCRLRPDQRAFEMGMYEVANELKGMQEDKQRATRRAREEGRIGGHRPRWFRAETDGDTGERVWNPSRVEDGHLEYWVERERVWRGGGIEEWKGVERIFIDEPDLESM